MRAFVAIDLPDEVRQPLVQVQENLTVGRIVAEENLHLTLAFLGDAGEAELEELHFALDTMALPAIEIRISGVDLYGDMAQPRLVVASVADNPALSDLQKRVERAARGVGLDLPHRRFRPHVTLARFGRSGRIDTGALDRFLAANAGFSIPGCSAATMGLYASTLRPDGAEYDVLASYPLG